MSLALENNETQILPGEFDDIRHRNFDKMAADVLDCLIRRGATLSLEECRAVFTMVQQIFQETGRADPSDICNIEHMAEFLELNQRDGAGRSFRAFVNRFGNEAAKAQFSNNRIATREESRIDSGPIPGLSEGENETGLIHKLQKALRDLLERITSQSPSS